MSTDIFNYRKHPITGADESVLITDECHTVPSSGKPYVRLHECIAPGTAVTITATLPGSTFSATSEADCFVTEATPDVPQGLIAHMTIGQTSAPAQRNRGMVRFPLVTLPSIAGLATVSMNLRNTSGAGGYPSLWNVGLHSLSSSFSEATETWNTQPAHNVVAEDIVQFGGAGFYTWDITNLYNSWKASPGTNFGLLVKSADEFTPDQLRDVSTREDPGFQPVLTVIEASSGMVSVGSVLPTAVNEFVVSEEFSAVAFHSLLAGAEICVTYTGLGTSINAENLCRIFGP